MADYIRWLRGQVGPALVPLVFTTALIRDAAGRLLFQHRADFGSAWWGLPGGLFEPGETPAACLRREVREETGLEVTPLRLTGVYSSLRYLVTYPNGDRVQQVTLCYLCELAGGALRPERGEIVALRFFPPDALPPRPPWYADMAAHALANATEPYFDPPERQALDTPFPDLLAARRAVGSAPLIWPGAAAAVRDEAGRLLLQRRADNGQWGLPGGSLDVGETLAHTAIRETREETGLDVRPRRVLGCFAGHEVVFPNGDRLYPVGTLFECHVTGGALHPDGRESTEARFFAPTDLPPLSPIAAERVHAAFASHPEAE